jgi:hypothetical protein
MTSTVSRPLVLAVALHAICGCGGNVQTSSGEDGAPTPGDAAVDSASDSIVPVGDGGPGGDADATTPPFSDSGSIGDATLRDSSTSDARDGAADGQGGICGPATCHNGCCNGSGECVDPPTSGACGALGESCVECGAGMCMGAMGCLVPQPTCGPSNCGGCCIGAVVGDAAEAACFLGTDGNFCGHGGTNCGPCGEGQDCRPLLFDAGGFCQANNSCDSTNCTGCCLGNVCAQGTQAEACGIGGATCTNCGDGGACSDGTCACGGPPDRPPCPDE